MIPINLVVEDLLSKSVVIATLRGSGKDFAVNTIYEEGGYGYIRSKIRGFNSAAKGCPYLVVTDLDTQTCASSLIQEWFGNVIIESNMIFRIAVREIESWVLADREKFSEFLGIRLNLIPDDTDSLVDPKATLIYLTKTSRKRTLRERIVPENGAKQGPDYNAALSEFIRSSWRINMAINHSLSLRRAFNRIRNFEPVWNIEN